MENLILIIAFTIVFGGIGYIINQMLDHFDKKESTFH
jgi:preprotein translocase subunit SecE